MGEARYPIAAFGYATRRTAYPGVFQDVVIAAIECGNGVGCGSFLPTLRRLDE